VLIIVIIIIHIFKKPNPHNEFTNIFKLKLHSFSKGVRKLCPTDGINNEMEIWTILEEIFDIQT
jgi:hypothetical protein